LKPHFYAALAGGDTLEAVRERWTVICFFEVATSLSSSVLAELEIVGPLQTALQKVSDAVLQTASELQVSLLVTPVFPTLSLSDNSLVVVMFF
jgi:hypothetical protein